MGQIHLVIHSSSRGRVITWQQPDGWAVPWLQCTPRPGDAPCSGGRVSVAAPGCIHAWAHQPCWGAHTLCNVSAYLAPGAPCTTISVGIGHDLSFDDDLAARHGCAGLGLDPTARARPTSPVLVALWLLSSCSRTTRPSSSWCPCMVPMTVPMAPVVPYACMGVPLVPVEPMVPRCRRGRLHYANV